MGAAETEIIFSDDYTRIAQHDSRSWTIKDISLAPIGGASWVAARTAARRTVLVWVPVMAAPLAALLLVLGWNPFIALFTLPVRGDSVQPSVGVLGAVIVAQRCSIRLEP